MAINNTLSRIENGLLLAVDAGVKQGLHFMASQTVCYGTGRITWVR